LEKTPRNKKTENASDDGRKGKRRLNNQKGMLGASLSPTPQQVSYAKFFPPGPATYDTDRVPPFLGHPNGVDLQSSNASATGSASQPKILAKYALNSMFRCHSRKGEKSDTLSVVHDICFNPYPLEETQAISPYSVALTVGGSSICCMYFTREKGQLVWKSSFASSMNLYGACWIGPHTAVAVASSGIMLFLDMVQKVTLEKISIPAGGAQDNTSDIPDCHIVVSCPKLQSNCFVAHGNSVSRVACNLEEVGTGIAPVVVWTLQHPFSMAQKYEGGQPPNVAALALNKWTCVLATCCEDATTIYLWDVDTPDVYLTALDMSADTVSLTTPLLSCCWLNANIILAQDKAGVLQPFVLSTYRDKPLIATLDPLPWATSGEEICTPVSVQHLQQHAILTGSTATGCVKFRLIYPGAFWNGVPDVCEHKQSSQYSRCARAAPDGTYLLSVNDANLTFMWAETEN
jgi:WD40 repeat protein